MPGAARAAILRPVVITADTESDTDKAAREEALERIKKRRDLRTHVVVYVLINAALWGVWAFTTDAGYPWPAWITGGWGAALLINV